MREFLTIKNFKCFQNTKIPLSGLTVVAGANGNGKSTAIQGLLLLRKTIEENFDIQDGYFVSHADGKIEKDTDLNSGYLLNLGHSSLIANRNSGESEISMGIGADDKMFTIHYESNSAVSDLSIRAKSCTPAVADEIPLLKKAFYYLNAERLGPRVNQATRHYEFPNTGFQGENTAQMLADVNYKIETDEARRHWSSASPRIEQQLNAWLSDLMTGVRVTIVQSIDTLTAQIRVENAFTKGEPTLATNIGFGISYVLPILATGLIAEKGSYMIVENPEAHLHPSAQSKIGRFLAVIAQAGVRVIVETHSDHVVNGIQIAAAKQEIASEMISINFFSQSEDSSYPIIENIHMSTSGELSSWPKGFFDQSQIDLAQLFKLRRK